MEDFSDYRLAVVAPRASSLRGIPTQRAADADIVVVGRENLVVKDRHGPSGRKLTKWEMAALRRDVQEVVES